MQGTQLWFKRLKQDFHFQATVLFTVFDWTIILYILVTFLGFEGIIYHSWLNTVPEWLNGVPYFVYFLGCYLLCWQGKIRTFMEEADQLYLLQYPKIIKMIRNMGALYSVCIIIIKWLLVVGLLFPLTNHFRELNILDLLEAILYFLGLNLVIISYKQVVYQSTWYLKLIIDVFVFCIFALLSYGLVLQLKIVVLLFVSFVIISIAFWQIVRFQSQYKTFFIDIEREQKNRVKLILWLFSVNPEVNLPKPKKLKKRNLIFWRNSKRIYEKRSPENSVTEVFIKTFFREKTNVFSYFQQISITAALLLVAPIWLKWLVALGFFIYFKGWIVLLFKEILKQNPYLASDYGKMEYLFLAQKKCEKIFVYPGVILVFFIAGISTLIVVLI